MQKNLKIGYLLDFYGPLLTDRQREALDMYYNMDFSLAEIAEEFGVTRQGARGFILQGESRLMHMEETLRHAALYQAASDALEAIRASVSAKTDSSEKLRGAEEALQNVLERDGNGI